ncbi:MAG: MerR family transcriptional regulator [Deltaproteobacteria bacterium]|nr:MerR family transcriptional regulator [Deltaproteobacteria bacterium]MBW1991729.1 MerR family transcriptional regulator [Deltaproteobacteria bacterium]
MEARKIYSIGELAELAQVSRRTVRFYVALGLISPPLGRGRGRHYTDRHLEEILTVRRLQARGVSLGEIKAQRQEPEKLAFFLAEPPPPPLPTQLVTRIALDEGVVLEFAHEETGLTPGEMLKLARRCQEVIRNETGRRT